VGWCSLGAPRSVRWRTYAPAYAGRRTDLASRRAHSDLLPNKSDKEVTMKRRTAIKTGRSPALQCEALRAGSFRRYATMVEHLSVGYLRPLARRLAPVRHAA
jgi:hypothetical protein